MATHYDLLSLTCLNNLFQLAFIPCRAEQPLQGMGLQEKNRKRSKHTGNLLPTV